jgi:hypothetical protein
LSDTTTSALSCFKLDGLGNNYIEDLYFEIGTVTANTIYLEIDHAGSQQLRVRRMNADVGATAIQFDATAAHNAAFGYVDAIFTDLQIQRCTTGITSVGGDASIKEFHGGHVNAVVAFSPSPLTGAQFYQVSRGASTGTTLQPEWGWIVTTPGVPAGTGSGNAIQNTTGVPVMVNLSSPAAYAQAPYGTHVIDQNNTDTALAGDWSAVYLSPLGKIYFATAVPTSWKWYGV